MVRARWIAAAVAALALALPARGEDRWTTFPGIPPLPQPVMDGHVDHDGAKIWFATYGPATGAPVILLHGAAGNSENFGNQVPALVADGHRVIVMDSRGQGRSSWDGQRLGYELMATDVLAVMDALGLKKPAIVGWSDGAILGLVIAMHHPERVSRVFAFGANMDVKGLAPNAMGSPALQHAVAMSAHDYERLSPTPAGFPALMAALGRMLDTEPNYSAADLARIHGPAIAIADGDHEELILPEHTRYLARTIPGAKLILLKDVSHFGLAQDPVGFNTAMLGFLDAK